MDAAFHRLDEALLRFRTRQPHDRLHHGQRVARAMIDLTRKQELTLLDLLAFGDVDSDTAHSYHAPACIDARRRRAKTPAHTSVRPEDPKFRLERLSIDTVEIRNHLPQPRQIVRRDHWADRFQRYIERRRI